MDIRLAGFNVDKDAIDELGENVSSQLEEIEKVRQALSGINLDDIDLDKTKEFIGEQIRFAKDKLNGLKDSTKYGRSILESLTPETIAASYARISRDPRSIPELREDARKDVELSRKSNQAIIFTMGHKSIAEHAVFNFDIMGVSRKLVEAIEEKRLCGYTEKSQRYITLDGDYVVPREVINAGSEAWFREVVEKIQNKFYFDNLAALQEWHGENPDTPGLLDQMGVSESRRAGTIEGWGKEDARYSLAMATTAQIGETISARNLETLITKLRSAHTSEEVELGEKLFELVDGVAPSVIKYTEPTDYFAKTREELREVVEELIAGYPIFVDKDLYTDRSVIYTTDKRDWAILAGLIFSSSDLSFDESLQLVERVPDHDLKKIVEASIKYKEVHDPMLREYEIGTTVSEQVMSSSAFAQMKRHRMCTVISQAYNLGLDVTIPDSIIGIGKEGEFRDVISATNELYGALKSNPQTEKVAEYILTNAHRRRILVDANNRQIHAYSAERENLYAQWDIRRTANLFVTQMKKDSPLTLETACGKHEHDKVKERYLS